MKYDVSFNSGQRKVIITRNGFGPVGVFGVEKIGSFTVGGVDEDTNQVDPETLGSKKSSDHVLIAKAKEVLDKHGIENLDNLTYEDKASSAPDHDDLENMSTDDLPRTEAGSDPDVSNQKGGTKSTAGTDPTTTEPNGVTPKEGNESQTDTTDTTGDTDQDKKETIPQLKERIAAITDKDELQKVYDDEVAGQDRPGAKAAIEARANELADK